MKVRFSTPRPNWVRIEPVEPIENFGEVAASMRNEICAAGTEEFYYCTELGSWSFMFYAPAHIDCSYSYPDGVPRNNQSVILKRYYEAAKADLMQRFETLFAELG